MRSLFVAAAEDEKTIQVVNAEEPEHAESAAAVEVEHVEDTQSADDKLIQQQQHKFNELKKEVIVEEHEEEEEEMERGEEAVEKQVLATFVTGMLQCMLDRNYFVMPGTLASRIIVTERSLVKT